MFGAKYSRMKFWIWSVILFIAFLFVSFIFEIVKNDPQLGNVAAMAAIMQMAIAIAWLNTLANRIRDYGSNPAVAIIAILPLANIILALYYGLRGKGSSAAFRSR